MLNGRIDISFSSETCSLVRLNKLIYLTNEITLSIEPKALNASCKKSELKRKKRLQKQRYKTTPTIQYTVFKEIFFHLHSD